MTSERASRPWRTWSALDWLVGWYGLFQAGHLILNGRYLVERGDPPFPGPVGGWSKDAIGYLDAFATLDFLNAAVAVVFAIAWLRGHKWRLIGTVVLTASMYAAIAFSWGAVAADAWRADTSAAYLSTWVPFLPIVMLAYLWSRMRTTAAEAVRGRGPHRVR